MTTETGFQLDRRPPCVVCGLPQTDVQYIHPAVEDRRGGVLLIHIGFPICDLHGIEDLVPDQYVFGDLIVEVS